MSCEHAEDVCEYCLEKVQTQEAPQKKKSPPRKTIGDKTPEILLKSALLAGVGYTAYYSGKLFLGVFNFGVGVAKDLLKTILTSGE